MSFTAPEKVLLPEDANESSNFRSVNMLWWSIFLTVTILSPSLILLSGEMLVRKILHHNTHSFFHFVSGSCVFNGFIFRLGCGYYT